MSIKPIPKQLRPYKFSRHESSREHSGYRAIEKRTAIPKPKKNFSFMNENAGASFSSRTDATVSYIKPAHFASHLLKPHPAPARDPTKEPL